MVKVGIVGASGYTGIELVKIFARHPQVEITFATSDSYVGKQLSDAFPCAYDIPLIAHEAAPLAEADVVFLALPHGASADFAKRALDAGASVIDLSADFRLHDAAVYEKFYGLKHHVPELLPQAVYGLPELHREQIKNSKLIANPGCYPTGVILGLAPIVRAGANDGTIIVDSKSGVSGAGRKPSLTTHFVEVYDNFAPYNIGRVHRHLSEMEQELREIRENATLIFSPHLLPVNRGILSTMYVKLSDGWDEQALRELYADTYRGEPFVRILPSGQIASLAHSVYTNYCVISIHAVPDVGQAIICASIDNLVKGASGQAVQNMNLMFGCSETTALL
ncbi:MAG: N-acetyl-gamma-glutamyl-phosphate reductase [Chloroflexi bacterium]|nr:N-acetyl-gamma-glutamyl-phosphate reductase [Chloroflexota bacterium]